MSYQNDMCPCNLVDGLLETCDFSHFAFEHFCRRCDSRYQVPSYEGGNGWWQQPSWSLCLSSSGMQNLQLVSVYLQIFFKVLNPGSKFTWILLSKILLYKDKYIKDDNKKTQTRDDADDWDPFGFFKCEIYRPQSDLQLWLSTKMLLRILESITRLLVLNSVMCLTQMYAN